MYTKKYPAVCCSPSLPTFKYLPRDLADIQFWAAFDEDIIVPLAEVFEKDEILRDRFKNGELRKDVIVSGTQWNHPVRIPRGMGVRMNFGTHENLQFQIKDYETGRKTGHLIERNEGGSGL